jgi:hypothetical protein
MAGKHPKYTQELLAHASISITLDTYFHVIEGRRHGRGSLGWIDTDSLIHLHVAVAPLAGNCSSANHHRISKNCTPSPWYIRMPAYRHWLGYREQKGSLPGSLRRLAATQL